MQYHYFFATKVALFLFISPFYLVISHFYFIFAQK